MSRALLAAGGGLASLGIFLSLPPPKDTRVVCSPRTASLAGCHPMVGVRGFPSLDSEGQVIPRMANLIGEIRLAGGATGYTNLFSMQGRNNCV